MPRSGSLRSLPFLAASLVALAGCSAASDDTATDEGALGTRVGQEQVSTSEPAVGLLDGYATLFDLRRSSCVVAQGDRMPNVGQPQQTTTIKLVQSDTQLANELGLDATLSVKAVAWNANASASLVRSFKNSTSSVHYLISSTQSYVATQVAGVTLTPDALALLRTDPVQFAQRCGDRFVSSVTYEARVVALVTFDTTDEEHALSLQAGIGAGAGVGPAQVDASMKTKLSNTSKRTDVQSSMTVIAQGFAISSSDALLGIGGTADEKLKRIDEVGQQMATSIAADRQKDATGYAANNARSAIPASLTLTRFSAADNAPSEAADAFRKTDDTFRKTETFIRAFGKLKLQMEHAYKDEISEFQAAGPEAQAGYNLLPPAVPKRYSSELGPIASAWAERFRADDGVNVGKDLAKVTDTIDRCVENAKNGAFADCHLNEDPTSLPAYAAAQGAITDYVQSARIAKMRFYVLNTGATASYKTALGECASNAGWMDRLPSADEARLLAPLVAGYGGGAGKTVWIADTGSCTYRNSGMSFSSNPLDASQGPSVGCESWSVVNPGSRSVICVPQSGPVGKRPDL